MIGKDDIVEVSNNKNPIHQYSNKIVPMTISKVRAERLSLLLDPNEVLRMKQFKSAKQVISNISLSIFSHRGQDSRTVVILRSQKFQNQIEDQEACVILLNNFKGGKTL